MRLKADYSFAPQVDEEEAKEVLSWTKEFVKEIEDYLVKGGYIK